MEFEEKVAKALKEMGFPIFYRDVTISYNKRFILGEFDIVSRDFIVEVKSGRDITTRGMDLMFSQNILPRGFAFYIYCPRFDDNEIDQLNDEFHRQGILYINDLVIIQQRHIPQYECSISSASIFMRLLRTPLSDIMYFQRLYMTKHTFIRVYRNVSYMRNPYSTRENIMWSEKIMTLIAANRIAIVENLPDPLLVSPLMGGHRSFHTRRLTVWTAESPIVLPLFHSLNTMKRLEDIVDINLANNRNYKCI
jgi:hypothetical protein